MPVTLKARRIIIGGALAVALGGMGLGTAAAANAASSTGAASQHAVQMTSSNSGAIATDTWQPGATNGAAGSNAGITAASGELQGVVVDGGKAIKVDNGSGSVPNN